MSKKYPNPTPRMACGAALSIVLITLTILFPKWLIVPFSVAIFFAVVYVITTLIQAVIDNEWHW